MVSQTLSHSSGVSIGSGAGAGVGGTNSTTPMGRMTTMIASHRDVPPMYLEVEQDHSNKRNQWQYLYVLPVLLLEFLAVALTRAVLPSLLLDMYGHNVYIVLGVADCVRGLLAFAACPVFGKLSDVFGRRICLLVTVLGTCAPVCSLAFFTWDDDGDSGGLDNLTIDENGGNTTALLASAASDATGEPEEASDSAGIWAALLGSSPESDVVHSPVHPQAITVFVVLLSLSGIFSSTFTLIFAYISDTVRRQDERVSAYGLALATFGLSFTIGMFC